MSVSYPLPLQRLIGYFSRLPGVGRRSAERLALSVLGWEQSSLDGFSEALSGIREAIHPCSICGNLSEHDTCSICQDTSRSRNLICVVEQPTQIMAFENAGMYHGLYHVLGGKLSPLTGKGPDDLRIHELQERIARGGITELIIATSSDVEGEATAHYLAHECAAEGLRISRIAAGLPVGADVNYADAATLTIALNGRYTLD